MIVVAPRIERALAANGPVVALESTIITHGMPWPQNLEVALGVEAAVREEGAEPATIAVRDRCVVVGMDEAELRMLARETGVRKLSSADLAHALVTGETGSTTVAATLAVMNAAGLKVFATGGIGGVHRGAERDFDISADLDALAAHDCVVVCAGPKAILDVPLTLEALETRGVPVVTMGSDRLPTFWSRDGAFPASLRLDSPEEVARLASMRAGLNQRGSILVAVPVPGESAIPSVEIGDAIERSLADARKGGIAGKQVTPFLLSRMLELTDGRSLEANTALILNNARHAARIAVALAR